MKSLNIFVAICLGALCITALWGAGISVHRDEAFAWIAGFCICYALLLALHNRGAGPLAWVVLCTALLNAAYLVNRDWWAREGWIAAATPMYHWLAHLHIDTPLIRAHSADGAMLALVPLQIAAVDARRAEGKLVWPWSVNALLSVLLLVAGASKGTLLLLPPAIAAGTRAGRAALFGIAARIQRRHWPLLAIGGAIPIAHAAAAERPWLPTSFAFAGDFWLTGVGAGNFPVAYSLYRAVLPVAYLQHAQNLYLDVWLTHGIVGLFSFVGLCAAAIVGAWRALRSEVGLDALWRGAALASLAIVIVYGLYDDPFYDGGRLLPVLGLVLGVTLRRAPRAAQHADIGRMRRMLFVALLPTSLIALSPVQAAVAANVGALLQARAELRLLDPGPSSDLARRAALDAASAAEWWYHRALALEARNGPANLRLGQIALLRRDLPHARAFLEAALQANPDGRAERLLLGEALWRSGQMDAAAALWRSVANWEISIAARRTQE